MDFKTLFLRCVQLWFNEGMFKPSFQFYKGYTIPVFKLAKDYIDFIEKLPLADTPEIFGMHPNADITYVVHFLSCSKPTEIAFCMQQNPVDTELRVSLLQYSYQSSTAKTCLDTILSIQPKDSSSGGGETRESIVKRQAGEMLAKLPSDYIPHEVRERLKKMGAIAPMNIFLRQEIDRMQCVISVIRTTLQDLQLAIEGTIIMSEVRGY